MTFALIVLLVLFIVVLVGVMLGIEPTDTLESTKIYREIQKRMQNKKKEKSDD